MTFWSCHLVQIKPARCHTTSTTTNQTPSPLPLPSSKPQYCHIKHINISQLYTPSFPPLPPPIQVKLQSSYPRQGNFFPHAQRMYIMFRYHSSVKLGRTGVWIGERRGLLDWRQGDGEVLSCEEGGGESWVAFERAFWAPGVGVIDSMTIHHS